MIDVMLVLLIIFLVAVPAMVNGVAAQPPVGANLQDHPEEAHDQTLAIGADGRYYLNKMPVAMSALADRLHAIYDGRTDRVLFVRADKRVKYARVTDALDIAAHGGVRVVGMVAELAASDARR